MASFTLDIITILHHFKSHLDSLQTKQLRRQRTAMAARNQRPNSINIDSDSKLIAITSRAEKSLRTPRHSLNANIVSNTKLSSLQLRSSRTPRETTRMSDVAFELRKAPRGFANPKASPGVKGLTEVFNAAATSATAESTGEELHLVTYEESKGIKEAKLIPSERVIKDTVENVDKTDMSAESTNEESATSRGNHEHLEQKVAVEEQAQFRGGDVNNSIKNAEAGTVKAIEALDNEKSVGTGLENVHAEPKGVMEVVGSQAETGEIILKTSGDEEGNKGSLAAVDEVMREEIPEEVLSVEPVLKAEGATIGGQETQGEILAKHGPVNDEQESAQEHIAEPVPLKLLTASKAISTRMEPRVPSALGDSMAIEQISSPTKPQRRGTLGRSVFALINKFESMAVDDKAVVETMHKNNLVKAGLKKKDN